MNFFFDRCLPYRAAKMLAIYTPEHPVVHHDDDRRFDSRTDDEVWMRAIAGDDPRPVALSGDNRILKNPSERQVLQETALSMFFFAKGWTKLPITESAWRLVKIWPEIIRRADNTRQRLYEISSGGAMKIEELRL